MQRRRDRPRPRIGRAEEAPPTGDEAEKPRIVRGPRGCASKIPLSGGKNIGRVQFRQDEKIRIACIQVQPVKGEDVCPVDNRTDERRNVKVFKHHRRSVGMLGRCVGIEREG